jgi:ankyrin repeat protein
MTDKGQTDSVKNMIQSYVDVNGTTVAEKRTVLQAAAKKGNTELVNFLIDAGADVDLADIEERTPLWFAAKHNNPFTAHALIKSGANLDTLSDTGENGNCSTPLWEAAANGHSNLVKLLLDSKADKNKKNLSQNLTPMQKASRNQHQQVVDLLREYGADDIDAIRARELREKAELQARQREITEATNQLKAGLLHGAKVATVCVVVPAAKTAAAAALCTIQ